MTIGSEFHEDVAPPGDVFAQAQSKFSSATIPYFLSTADAFIILTTSIAAGIGYQWFAGNAMSSIFPYCAVGLMASFIHILRMSGSGYYDFPDSVKPHVEIGQVLVCWLTTGLLLAFFAFLLKIGVVYSRGAFVVFYFLTPIGLLGVRKLAKIFLTNAVARGAIGRRDVLLIGDIDELAALESRDLMALCGAAKVVHFSLSREIDPSTRMSADSCLFKSVSDFVRLHNCREVLLAIPWNESARMDFVRDQVKILPVAVRLLPDIRVRSLTNYSSSVRQRVLAVEIQRAPLSSAERVVKRTMDLVIATLALLFFLPIMIFTALAIKLDSPGPIIFRQHRKGFNGRQFVMFKFRTMTVQENGSSIVQATRNDPRVTVIGRLLRSASIDELPQLLNVLHGEMSLIGPRPHALAHDNQFEKILGDYAFRHHVKPGITGWAQCNGARGGTPSVEHISERVRLDLWYINNWSLWLDIQILIKTFFEVLRKRNAY